MLSNIDEIINNWNSLKVELALKRKDLDLDKALKQINRETIGGQGASIEGNFDDYMNLLIKT